MDENEDDDGHDDAAWGWVKKDAAEGDALDGHFRCSCSSLC